MVRTFLCGAAVIGAMAFAAAAHAQGRPQIILFQEDNYRGNRLVIDRDTANLTDFHFNDRVSSVRVMGGVWRLCENDYGRGRCVTVSRDEPKMGRLGMDDNITSVMRDDGRGRGRGPGDRDDRRRGDRGRDRDWDGR
jgi:hypothetical protein